MEGITIIAEILNEIVAHVKNPHNELSDVEFYVRDIIDLLCRYESEYRDVAFDQYFDLYNYAFMSLGMYEFETHKTILEKATNMIKAASDMKKILIARRRIVWNL